MARNRKRRSDRRPRRPADDADPRRGVATARGQRAESVDETPDPLEHATPDVELAEAQLARGRPELAGEAVGGEEFFDEGDGPENEGPDDEAPDDDGSGSADGGGGTDAGLAPRPDATPSPWVGSRLVHFLQGSWRELQRVQWPDRRQVMQATGVVIGFVIVAGVFLGVADWAATKIVHLILE